MPRTRTDLERETKRAEVVDAAIRRLHEGGYEALSVAAIARELGVAQNAVYWYFPSKDHLFVAALEQMLRDVVARKPPRQRVLERKILWFVDQLDALSDVRAAMEDRARTSEVVAAFATELQATWRRMLTNVLSDRVDDDELPVVVETILATIQGTLASRRSAAERRRLIAFALGRLVPSATATAARQSTRRRD